MEFPTPHGTIFILLGFIMVAVPKWLYAVFNHVQRSINMLDHLIAKNFFNFGLKILSFHNICIWFPNNIIIFL